MKAYIEQRNLVPSQYMGIDQWYGRSSGYDENEALEQASRWASLYGTKTGDGSFAFRVVNRDGVVLLDTEAPPRKQVFYVAHPVSGDAIGNCMKVVRWVKWLTEHDPTRVYIAPWVAEVLAFPSATPEVYERALQDDEEVIAHLDGIIMVGGKVSSGMKREWDRAMREHLYGVDMSRYATPEDVPADFELEPAE